MSDATDRPMTATERSRWHRAKQQEAGIPRVRVRSPAEKAAIRIWKVSDAGRDSRNRRNQEIIDNRPFIGCDGEGCGEDELKRQHYMLLRIGDRELYTGKPLNTDECLGFILQSPPETYLVGYGWRYDIPQILRDIPADRWPMLWKHEPARPGVSPYLWYRDYGIQWLDGNYLRICRSERHGQGRRAIPGTARTIYEVSGFFQKPFVQALKDFGIGSPADLAFIGKNKDFRGLIPEIDAETRLYCQLECDYLADLMTRFRTLCLSVDPPIRPHTWNGSGKLADAEHKRCGTITRKALEGRLVALSDTGGEQLPPASPVAGVLPYARRAYFGGRFEMFRFGEIPGPIYAYDINSAYPFAMQSLPCLFHGTWRYVEGRALNRLAAADPSAVYVADVRFDHPDRPMICGLPIRSKLCSLSWPLAGNGTYWSVELRAAVRLGATIVHKGGWLFERHCDCQGFRWVKDRYDWRVSVGKDAIGIPVKNAINSAYGKLAQRIGTPLFQNAIHAGLITAHCRAQLMDAASEAPDSVIMFATDALFTKQPLDLPISKDLGAWDAAEHPHLFCVQPGLYWGMVKDGVDRMKTRGISPKFIRSELPRFETAWAQWCEQVRAAVIPIAPDPPFVPIQISYFVGMRLAKARGKPDLAGRWMKPDDPDNPPRRLSFDWRRKRRNFQFETDLCVVTDPLPGGRDVFSHGFDDIPDEAMAGIEAFRMAMEANRDWYKAEPEME